MERIRIDRRTARRGVRRRQERRAAEQTAAAPLQTGGGPSGDPQAFDELLLRIDAVLGDAARPAA